MVPPSMHTPSIWQRPLTIWLWLQTPAAQASMVQAEPSAVQVLPSAKVTCSHFPVLLLHKSVVHALPSSQFLGVPTQLPFTQPSESVHALPSEHAWLGRISMTQPFSGVQPSAVQASPSLHAMTAPMQ